MPLRKHSERSLVPTGGDTPKFESLLNRPMGCQCYNGAVGSFSANSLIAILNGSVSTTRTDTLLSGPPDVSYSRNVLFGAVTGLGEEF